jgi:hypothetical protein
MVADACCHGWFGYRAPRDPRYGFLNRRTNRSLVPRLSPAADGVQLQSRGSVGLRSTALGVEREPGGGDLLLEGRLVDPVELFAVAGEPGHR